MKPALCSACGRNDGKHASWGLFNECGCGKGCAAEQQCALRLIQEVQCKGVFKGKHCPNAAPIGGGGFCGPCRWSKEKRTTITEPEMAMEMLSEYPPRVING